jgi:hypothetical protein
MGGRRMFTCALFAVAITGVAGPASAATDSEAHVVLVEPFSNPCPAVPDTGVITGSMHVLVSETETHSTMQVDWQFSKGVSTTGTVYEGNDVHRLVVSEMKGAFTIEFDDVYELISQDSSSNLIVRTRFTITFDPATGIDISDRSTIECSGPTPPPA